jgi:hypothetical protein
MIFGVVAGLAAAAAAAWSAAPWVSMHRHGTLDAQTRAAVRAESERVRTCRTPAPDDPNGVDDPGIGRFDAHIVPAPARPDHIRHHPPREHHLSAQPAHRSPSPPPVDHAWQPRWWQPPK